MNTCTINTQYLPDPAAPPAVAIEQQRRWAGAVREEALSAPPQTIAAVDVHPHGDLFIAVAALVAYPSLEPIAVVPMFHQSAYPYVPGLLSWREAPAAVAALQMLPHPPDALIADGHGRAHPRRFGLACHLGLITGLPTIGCAKSRLVGRYEPLPEDVGSTSPLIDKGESIGTVLRTRAGVSPVFVSVGHRITLAAAVALIRARDAHPSPRTLPPRAQRSATPCPRRPPVTYTAHTISAADARSRPWLPPKNLLLKITGCFLTMTSAARSLMGRCTSCPRQSPLISER